jgi:hypothetical protein
MKFSRAKIFLLILHFSLKATLPQKLPQTKIFLLINAAEFSIYRKISTELN